MKYKLLHKTWDSKSVKYREQKQFNHQKQEREKTTWNCKISLLESFELFPDLKCIGFLQI